MLQLFEYQARMKLTIEKPVYGGDGLARIAPVGKGRSKIVFVPYTLEGETVEADVVEEKQGFSRAVVREILQPSPLRVSAPCPHFGTCGGCHYQLTTYENQLLIKDQILRETLQRTANITWIEEIKVHTGEPWNYRNRARFHRVKGDAPGWGYMRGGSNDVLPVRECPLISPLLQRLLTAVWEPTETPALKFIQELEVFTNGDESECVLSLVLATPQVETTAVVLEPWLEKIKEQVPELRGGGIFPALGQDATKNYSWASPQLNYQVNGHSYCVSAGSFFQTNHYLLNDMVATAIGDQTGALAWDLYSGVGLFTLPL